jgi:hypothetical protein
MNKDLPFYLLLLIFLEIKFHLKFKYIFLKKISNTIIDLIVEFNSQLQTPCKVNIRNSGA